MWPCSSSALLQQRQSSHNYNNFSSHQHSTNNSGIIGGNPGIAQRSGFNHYEPNLNLNYPNNYNPNNHRFIPSSTHSGNNHPLSSNPAYLGLNSYEGGTKFQSGNTGFYPPNQPNFSNSAVHFHQSSYNNVNHNASLNKETSAATAWAYNTNASAQPIEPYNINNSLNSGGAWGTKRVSATGGIKPTYYPPGNERAPSSLQHHNQNHYGSSNVNSSIPSNRDNIWTNSTNTNSSYYNQLSDNNNTNNAIVNNNNFEIGDDFNINGLPNKNGIERSSNLFDKEWMNGAQQQSNMNNTHQSAPKAKSTNELGGISYPNTLNSLFPPYNNTNYNSSSDSREPTHDYTSNLLDNKNRLEDNHLINSSIYQQKLSNSNNSSSLFSHFPPTFSNENNKLISSEHQPPPDFDNIANKDLTGTSVWASNTKEQMNNDSDFGDGFTRFSGSTPDSSNHLGSGADNNDKANINNILNSNNQVMSSEDELISRYVNAPTGWGKVPIKQDSAWDRNDRVTPDPSDPNTLGTHLWKSQNSLNSGNSSVNTKPLLSGGGNNNMSSADFYSSSNHLQLQGHNIPYNSGNNKDTEGLSSLSSPLSATSSNYWNWKKEDEPSNHYNKQPREGGFSNYANDENSMTPLPNLDSSKTNIGWQSNNNNSIHLNGNNNPNFNNQIKNFNNSTEPSSAFPQRPFKGLYATSNQASQKFGGQQIESSLNHLDNGNGNNNLDEDDNEGGIGVWKSVEAAKQETSMYWNPNLINNMQSGESLSVLDTLPPPHLNSFNANNHSFPFSNLTTHTNSSLSSSNLNNNEIKNNNHRFNSLSDESEMNAIHNRNMSMTGWGDDSRNNQSTTIPYDKFRNPSLNPLMNNFGNLQDDLSKAHFFPQNNNPHLALQNNGNPDQNNLISPRNSDSSMSIPPKNLTNNNNDIDDGTAIWAMNTGSNNPSNTNMSVFGEETGFGICDGVNNQDSSNYNSYHAGMNNKFKAFTSTPMNKQFNSSVPINNGGGSTKLLEGQKLLQEQQKEEMDNFMSSAHSLLPKEALDLLTQNGLLEEYYTESLKSSNDHNINNEQNNLNTSIIKMLNQYKLKNITGNTNPKSHNSTNGNNNLNSSNLTQDKFSSFNANNALRNANKQYPGATNNSLTQSLYLNNTTISSLNNSSTTSINYPSKNLQSSNLLENSEGGLSEGSPNIGGVGFGGENLINQQLDQLNMAISSGLIDPAILNLKLSPHILLMLTQLLNLHKNSQSIMNSQKMLAGKIKSLGVMGSSNNGNFKQHADILSLKLEQVNQQITQLQNAISVAVNEHVTSTPVVVSKNAENSVKEGGIGQDNSLDLVSNNNMNPLSPTYHQKSRLTQWKLPSPPEKVINGGENNGDDEQVDSISLTTRSHSTGFVDSSAAEVLKIAEFRPGKPWSGFKPDIENDPYITPGILAANNRNTISHLTAMKDLHTDITGDNANINNTITQETIDNINASSSLDATLVGFNHLNVGANYDSGSNPQFFPYHQSLNLNQNINLNNNQGSNYINPNYKLNGNNKHLSNTTKNFSSSASSFNLNNSTFPNNTGGNKNFSSINNTLNLNMNNMMNLPNISNNVFANSAAANIGWRSNTISVNDLGINKQQFGDKPTWLVLKNLTSQVEATTLKTLCSQHGIVKKFYLNKVAGEALVLYSSHLQADKARKVFDSLVLWNAPIKANVVTNDMNLVQ
ncbi:unnamed protein product [Gordionus sp. m RMFG-2023]|uniref:probable cyclin-dependent serine/threonine-protein kinase DDB_G0292550 isoform X2 n=1 Tax=Gordionus sp. m RMFG-2023 TaxID=3053472 RepID=UPI0030DFB72E